MVRITEKLRTEKGCSFCLDKKTVSGVKGYYCPNDKCKYDEMDGFDTYEDYFKSKGDPFEALKKAPTSTEYMRYYMREYKDKKPKK